MLHVSSKITVYILVVLALTGATLYVLYLPEVFVGKTGLWLKPLYDYVEEEYEPKWISNVNIGPYPPRAVVKNVPWISHNKSYCASTCLQMVAYKCGVEEPVEYFNFLMGFTYGGNLQLLNNYAAYIPTSDPIPGFKYASKHLGLQYNLLVTNDRKLFIDTCKYLISRDIPIILPVDAKEIYNMTYPAPHFELIIGYDGRTFYAYEPVLEEEKFVWNEKGLKVPEETLERANREFNKLLYRPWKYSLIFFIKVGSPVKDLTPILKRNGELQIGFKYPIGYTGAEAIRALANYTIQGKVKTDYLIFGLSLASISRHDNAKFLKNTFITNSLIVEAASKLEEAAKIYEQVLKLILNGISPYEREQIANALLQAAKFEEEAGKLLIKAALEQD